MKTVKLLLASANPGKLREFCNAAHSLGISVEPVPGIQNLPPLIEDGRTFEENARKKALHYSSYVEGLVFADDSGISADALSGAPGIYSARWAGPQGDDVANNEKLLRELRSVPAQNRAAHYACVIALAASGKILAVVEGRADGFKVHAIAPPRRRAKPRRRSRRPRWRRRPRARSRRSSRSPPGRDRRRSRSSSSSSTATSAAAESLTDPAADLPPIQAEPISALLPIFNDHASLQPSLEAWISVLNNLNRDYEILLVDDGSTDGSLDLIQTLMEKNPQVRLLRHETHAGFGACLRTGLEAARYPLLLISTCDGCYQPADLTRHLKWIDKVHLVAGYRSIASRRYQRNWAERWYRWIIRIIFGLRLKDPECWFLLARRSIFSRIPIQCAGAFAFAELLSKANFLGCLMSEVPVSYQPSPEATAKWSAVTLPQKLAGFRRIFSQPDFGPAKLPTK